MKKYFLLFVLSPFWMFAQDDLMDILDEAQEDTLSTIYASSVFKGTRIINAQSNEMPAPGVLQFMIMHRFGTFNEDWLHNFFGLDNAFVRFSLDYTPVEWLNIGLGRSSYLKMYDGYVKYRLVRQSKGAKSFPVGITGYSSLNINTERFFDGLERNLSDRMIFVHQLIISRKFDRNFSFLLSPTAVHYNLVETPEQQNTQFVLGLGGRYMLNRRVGITAEYFWQIQNHSFVDGSGGLSPYQNGLSLGIDIETGGHVFQLHLTNSTGLSDPVFMTQTGGRWDAGDIHFGFNISRVFETKRKKTTPERE